MSGRINARGHNDQDEKPLVSIQPYQERQQPEKPRNITTTSNNKNERNKKKEPSQSKEVIKPTLGRENSFLEIQRKFKSLERRQRKDNQDNQIKPPPLPPPEVREAKKWIKKLDEQLENGVEDDHDDRSDSVATSKRLENYLIRQSRLSNNDDFEHGGEHASSHHKNELDSRQKVKRQASKCSSILAPTYRRNMEAVGEFEKVWSWNENTPSNENSLREVPMTKELCPEYRRNSNSKVNRALSPVERKSRTKTPEHPGWNQAPPSRGLSSPAELRRPNGPLPPHPGFYPGPPHQMRLKGGRAASPDLLRRSSSRGGALSPDPVRILRREKTSLFDNRYPSLDLRSEKRKSLYELKEDVNRADLRRRSYHELNNPDMMLPGHHPHHPHIHPGHHPIHHNFQHSGRKPRESSKKTPKMNGRAMAHPMPPGPPWMGDPRAFGYPPHIGPPPHNIPPGVHAQHMAGGRFGLAPVRPF